MIDAAESPLDPAGGAPLVAVTEEADYQGQPTFRIATPTAIYLFHKHGAGLASLIDPDGNDWISYRPVGGSDGRHRGIPNLAHPEGVFHPGTETAASHLVACAPDKVTIGSESNDGHWACKWDFHADRAVLTVTKVAHLYWFLYEGTPGGSYDESAAHMVDSSGARRSCTERWEARLPEPRWIYFGHPASRYVLLLMDQTPRPADVTDSFWSMQKNMTVFGFGRGLSSKSERWKQLSQIPAAFTIALVERSRFREFRI